MTRQSLLRPGFLLLAVLLLGAPGFAAGRQDPPDGRMRELPKDGPQLIQYAQERMNQGDWKEADRAFRAYLEKAPDGSQTEPVLVQLGNLHQGYSHQYARSREYYAKACERFPKSPQYWSYRFQIAASWQYQGLRDKAAEEYRKISKEAPEAAVRTSAIQQSWAMEGKYMYLQVNQSFTTGQNPVVNVQLSKVDTIVFRATHIRFDSILERLGAADAPDLQGALAKVPPEGRRLLKEWTEHFTYEDHRYWRSEAVKVPSTESGVYLVEAEHEGVVFTVTVLVSRYGMITKSAAGRLVCFAQDRASSRPVEGVRIRTLAALNPLVGITDADGIFAAEGFQGGVVIGVKDGELVTSEAPASGGAGERALSYVTTDRPIYRPGQTVQFHVVHRTEHGQELRVHPGEKLWVEIRDPKGNSIYDRLHEIGDFGSCSGQLRLGDEPALGEYTLLTRGEKDDAHLHQWDWQWAGRWGHEEWNGVRFRVDEYRKPEFRVDVDWKRKTVLQGEDLEAAIEARYYFGSPVADAEVRYTVFRRPTWPRWRSWAFYCDWYLEDEEDALDGYKGTRGRGARAWGGEPVLQGTGRTDAQGKLAVRFTSQKWTSDAVYELRAEVSDLSRRVVDGAGSCKATRAEFGLSLTLNKYVYTPGESVNVRVRAATADDRTVGDQKIVLRAYERRFRNPDCEDTLVSEAASKTDENGIAEFTLAPKREGGYLWLVAEAQDRRSNSVTAEHAAWISGGAWSGNTVNLNGVDLILDKKSYEPGDMARVLVTSQYENATFLVTLEGKELHEHRVVTLTGHARLLEFKIDREAYAPNVFIAASAIRDSLYLHQQRKVVVNPSRKFVNVEILPEKNQYRPRQKARYELRATDADGKPVAAEIEFAVIDDSLYALQGEYAPDIRRQFIHPRRIEVATTCSLQYYDYGRADEKRKAENGLRARCCPTAPPSASADAAKGMSLERADQDAAGEGGIRYAPTEIRSKFQDTLVWRTVTTDGAGRALVEVELPDNLTTWTATARAATRDSRFGQQIGSVICRKEMIVRLETPRFFTQHDETVVSAVVHNYLDGEKQIRIELEAQGIEVEGARELEIRVGPEGQKRIDWKARIRSAGTATVTVKALSDVDSDAARLSVPVVPHGTMKWDSRAGMVQDRVIEKVLIPEGSVAEGSELLVCVSPTHAAMVLDALEYLAGYPYGCVEQTMSRFLPTVVASRALQKLGIRRPELEAELPAMVSSGLQRLYNFQQPDGGWGWWQYDQSNAWTTAYVMGGLALARETDHGVSAEVFARGVRALHHHLDSSKDPNVQAYLLHALRASGERDDSVEARLSGRLSELNDYSKALLAVVLERDGLSTAEVIESLAADAHGIGGSVHYQGAAKGGWQDHDVEITAAALRAFVACNSRHPLVPRLVAWLSSARQGNYWASTKQTAMVVYALVDYLAVTGDLHPDMTVSLSLNGERVYSERVTDATWQSFDGMRRFPASKLRKGENTITIEKTGNGNPLYSVYAKYYVEAEGLPASEGGIRIERRYARVARQGGKEILEPLAGGAVVASGDELEVTLVVEADQDYEWLMMEDPLPSGFEPIRETWGRPGWHWGYWYSRKEFHDQKVSIATTRMGHGRHEATYRMRAETPGDFHVMPAQVWNMYQTQIGANSAEFRIRVADSK